MLTKANFSAVMIFEFRVYKPSQHELHATAAQALYIEISKILSRLSIVHILSTLSNEY